MSRPRDPSVNVTVAPSNSARQLSSVTKGGTTIYEFRTRDRELAEFLFGHGCRLAGDGSAEFLWDTQALLGEWTFRDECAADLALFFKITPGERAYVRTHNWHLPPGDPPEPYAQAPQVLSFGRLDHLCHADDRDEVQAWVEDYTGTGWSENVLTPDTSSSSAIHAATIADDARAALTLSDVPTSASGEHDLALVCRDVTADGPISQVTPLDPLPVQWSGESFWFSTQRAAKMLGITPDAVRRWVKRSRIIVWKIGRTQHLRLEDIRARANQLVGSPSRLPASPETESACPAQINEEAPLTYQMVLDRPVLAVETIWHLFLRGHDRFLSQLGIGASAIEGQHDRQHRHQQRILPEHCGSCPHYELCSLCKHCGLNDVEAVVRQRTGRRTLNTREATILAYRFPLVRHAVSILLQRYWTVTHPAGTPRLVPVSWRASFSLLCSTLSNHSR